MYTASTTTMSSYRAARVFDGVSEIPIEDGCVTVTDGTIAYVGPFRDADLPAEVRDLGDATILPGLVDAHVHLVWSASRAPHEVVAAEPRELTVLRAAANARDHLRSGVTTVRDVGSTDAIAVRVARALDDGILEGPSVQAAGRAIAMTGGHAWWIAREADGSDAVRAAVRAEIKGGARCIKLMASGGIYGESEGIGSPQLTLEELQAAVEAAQAAGLPVTAHAYAEKAIQNALEAGVDAIEHGSFLTDAQAREMAARGVFLVPTLSVYRAMAARADELELREYVRDKTEQVLAVSEQAFRLALEHGVPLAAGTDAGSPGHPHRGALAAELEAMVDAGATPMQALRCATAGGATLLGHVNEVGTLEPGKAADLVVVAGDAAADVSRVRDVVLVVKGGVPVVEATSAIALSTG
jgi:imidazolonepropionase-like amidohydrolase